MCERPHGEEVKAASQNPLCLQRKSLTLLLFWQGQYRFCDCLWWTLIPSALNACASRSQFVLHICGLFLTDHAKQSLTKCVVFYFDNLATVNYRGYMVCLHSVLIQENCSVFQTKDKPLLQSSTSINSCVFTTYLM